MPVTKRKALIQVHLRQAQKKKANAQRAVQRTKVRLPFKAEHLDEAKLREAVARLPA
jgi:hypothetical protein